MPSLTIAQEVEGPVAPIEGPSEPADNDEILVIADRLRGLVDTVQAPILELEEEDIAAYGAGSIADLVAAIEPQTSSNRGRGGGRPVFLINGVRVGSFREFRSYPPEAVQKVEVLPEETAQKFGFPPDRRVVNIILKDNYSAITVEAEYEQPSLGGYSRTEQEATLLKITNGGRINLNVEASDVTLLTESERSIIQTPGSVPDVATDPNPAAFRSLIADSAQLEASANYSKAFLESGSSIGLNATFNRSDSRSLSGLNTVVLTDTAGNSAIRAFDPQNPLERRSRSDTYASSFSYNRPVGGFQLTATADGSMSDSRTEIDRRADVTGLIADAASGVLAIDGAIPIQADAGFDISRSRVYSGNSKVTLRGASLYLPAGEVSTTFDLGYVWNRIESDDSLSGAAAQLTRGDLSGGVTVTVPITSTRNEVLDAIGSVSVTGQASFNHYSDFGTLNRWTGSINWQPADSLDLQASYVEREAPPSLSQLGSPQVTTLNVPTFDLRTGGTALVDITNGGNPNLLAEKQSDWNFSANWEFMDNARFRVDYSRNNSDNVSASFPFLTDAVEAAFPGRVTRDASGTLVALDRRPIDYFNTRSDRLSFGLNMRGSFGKARPQPGQGTRSSAGDQSRSQSRPTAGAGPSSGGGERRAMFMRLRERVCADDGEAFLIRLVQAAENGEPFAELPGFSAERAQRILARVRNEDGTVDRERLSEFRSRMCSADGGAPASRGGGAGRPRGPDFANMSDAQRAGFIAFRERVCADDGEAFLRRVAETLGKGEKLEELPEFHPEQAQRILNRMRNEDGSIDTERLKSFRARMCGRPGSGQDAGTSAGGRPAGARGRRGGGGFGRGGDGRGRFFFNLTHSILLKQEVQIAPGEPVLDLLDGDSLSSNGSARHFTRLEAGAFRGGLGTRLSVRYTGKARTNGTGAPGSTDLFFDDLATVNLRFFADLGTAFKKDDGLFKNMRLSLRADNIFDGRRIVRDSNGDIPIGFQPLLTDPTGRYLGFEIRKLF